MSVNRTQQGQVDFVSTNQGRDSKDGFKRSY